MCSSCVGMMNESGHKRSVYQPLKVPLAIFFNKPSKAHLLNMHILNTFLH